MLKRTLGPVCMIVATFWTYAAFAAPGEEDILIANFEGREYGDWTAQGEAFGRRPAGGNPHGRLENDAYSYLGRRLVNSLGQGNEATGTLTSPKFTIERTYINFLIGGGGFEGETCVNLLVDGDVARTATGKNREAGTGSKELLWHAWDVSDLRGKNGSDRNRR